MQCLERSYCLSCKTGWFSFHRAFTVSNRKSIGKTSNCMIIECIQFYIYMYLFLILTYPYPVYLSRIMLCIYYRSKINWCNLNLLYISYWNSDHGVYVRFFFIELYTFEYNNILVLSIVLMPCGWDCTFIFMFMTQTCFSHSQYYDTNYTAMFQRLLLRSVYHQRYFINCVTILQIIRNFNYLSIHPTSNLSTPSLSSSGAFIGGIMGGFAMRLGRRSVLIAMALPYTLAWLATALSTSVHMVSAASFCGGMLICCINMTTQVSCVLSSYYFVRWSFAARADCTVQTRYRVTDKGLLKEHGWFFLVIKNLTLPSAPPWAGC